MRVMRLAVLAACSGVPLTSVCQNPTVATVVKGEDLSNVPTAYQGQVKPGALLIVKGRHGSANFEPASAMAVGYAPQSTPVTLPDTDVTKIANLEASWRKAAP